ncbi:bifunctional adenosylcobinamide kinase/adenosylcobinamide-phosphate guanylyltransferase [Acidimicrobiia bacterium EGI L10123]|uniref:bifunctional adenosylcobinamide kinase/adenosylcobinamide-phosphate guanylyltransferase n=1 Tax=Salinilacustrithrix flava TaxID=2957203 RepID=UPI003D7C2719|nr:bifunctional adenosylcobinamide kinase/adenosylcobinamide-phosphate guanylyltransferase [Acidimicrobiia bacterium EGI L10123]
MIVLVLGGTRSGKSAVAESMAARLAGPHAAVTYVATARLDPADADHAARIEAHRARRPAAWTTVECTTPTDLPGVLRGTDGVVLLDSLGTWATGHPDLDPDPGPLVDALRARAGTTIVVGEEVGLAPHAPTELGRRFADALGQVNQAVSAVADHALLVVAGRAISLPEPGELPC